MPFDNHTVQEQEAWEHYKKIEAENHHLKKQLVRKGKEIKDLRHTVKALVAFKKRVESEKKARYRNNGKKRTKSNRTF